MLRDRCRLMPARTVYAVRSAQEAAIDIPSGFTALKLVISRSSFPMAQKITEAQRRYMKLWRSRELRKRLPDSMRDASPSNRLSHHRIAAGLRGQGEFRSAATMKALPPR